MLPLDRQVTSLALSKRLAEAGLPTDTLWAWAEREDDVRLMLNDGDFKPDMLRYSRLAPAYTASELLDWLRTANGDVLNRPSVEAMDNCWEARLNDPTLSPQYAQTPAEALGELALKVKEAK